MKRIVFALLLVALSTTGFAQSFSTANEVAPMPVAQSPMISFPTMATPTFTLGNTPTDIGSYLPAGTKGFFVAPTTAVAINYGGSTLAPGTGWPMIATATLQQVFYVTPHRVPSIYFCPNATATTPVIRVTPFK